MSRRIFTTSVAAGLSTVLLLGQPATSLAQEPVTDHEIRSQVESLYQIDAEVPEHSVMIRSDGGIVTLTGIARDLLSKERAALIAETVPGVRAVVNRIEVSPMVAPNDLQLQRDVSDALLFDSATESYEIGVTAEGGVVRLDGVVDSWSERELAGTVAKGVEGVTEVRNEIRIDFDRDRPDADILGDVRARLRWDALVDGAQLDVTVSDGAVEISGTVSSAAEKRRATEDAWVYGATSVDVADVTVEWAGDDPVSPRLVEPTEAEIEAAVEQALYYDPRVAGSEVTVVVSGTTVALYGAVASVDAMRAAVRDARNTTGVSRVEDHLTVDPTVAVVDEVAEERLSSSLRRAPLIDHERVRVDVRRGVARLEGIVDTNLERARVDEIASRTSGVQAVENLLVVAEPSPPLLDDPFVDDFGSAELDRYAPPILPGSLTDASIETEIEARLRANDVVDADDVEVTVVEGVATLAGTVHSWTAKRAATRSAYLGGAMHVVNGLAVSTF